MATIGEAFIKIKADTAAFGKELEQGLGSAINAQSAAIGASMKQIGKGITDVGKVLSVAVTAPVVGLGIAVVKTAADFETSMNKVRALTGATGNDFEQLRVQAIDLGAATMFSASEAADAMGFLAMAGFDTTEIMGAMPSVLQLAAAAQIDLGRAADITSNIMSGFGMTTEELAGANDVLVKTLSSTNTDLTQLGDAFKYVGPVAKGAGVSFNETAAAIGLLGNAGIQGTMAGTSLRGAITNLLTPTDKAAGIMERLGITVLDTSGNLLPLNDIIQQLETSSITTGEMMELFGQRAGPAMMALVEQGSGALRDLTAELDNAGGTAARIADIQMEGLNGAIEELKGAFETLMITIGDSGLLAAVQVLVVRLTDFVRGLNDVSPQVMNMAVQMAAAAAAAGPLLLVVGSLTKGLGSILLIAPTVSKALSGIGVSMGAAAGPIGIAVAAFATLMAVSPEFRSAMGDIAKSLAPVVKEIMRALVPAIKELGKVFGELARIAVSILTPRLDDLVKVVSGLSDAFETALDLFDEIASAAQGLASRLGVVGDAIGDLIPSFEGANAAGSIFGDIMDHFRSFVDPVGTGLGLLSGLLEQLGFTTEEVVSPLQQMVAEMEAAGFKSTYAASAMDEMKNISGGVNVALSNTAYQAEQTAIKTSYLQDAFQVMADAGVNVATLGLDPIVAGLGDTEGALEGVREKLGGWIASVQETMQGAAGAFFTFKEESLTSLSAFMTDMYGQIAAFNEWKTLLVQVAEKVPAEFLVEMGKLGPGAIEILRDVSTASETELEALRALYKAKGEATTDDWLTEFMQANPEMAAILEAYGITVDTQLSEVETIAGTAAEAIGTTIPDRIVEAIDRDGSKVSTEVDKAVSTATDPGREALQLHRAQEIGKSLADGIAAGVRANSGGVSTAVQALVDNALEAGRIKARTKSPSGLFRDELGVPIAQGVAIGITAGTPEVVLSMQNSMGVLIAETKAINLPYVYESEVGAPIVQGIADGITNTKGAAQMAMSDLLASVSEEARTAMEGLIKVVQTGLSALWSEIDSRRRIESLKENLNEAELALFRAEMQMQDAKRAMDEALRVYGFGSDEYRKASDAYEKAAGDFANAQDGITDTSYTLLKALEDQFIAGEISLDQYLKLAEAAGLEKDEIQKLIDAYNELQRIREQGPGMAPVIDPETGKPKMDEQGKPVVAPVDPMAAERETWTARQLVIQEAYAAILLMTDEFNVNMSLRTQALTELFRVALDAILLDFQTRFEAIVLAADTFSIRMQEVLVTMVGVLGPLMAELTILIGTWTDLIKIMTDYLLIFALTIKEWADYSVKQVGRVISALEKLVELLIGVLEDLAEAIDISSELSKAMADIVGVLDGLLDQLATAYDRLQELLKVDGTTIEINIVENVTRIVTEVSADEAGAIGVSTFSTGPTTSATSSRFSQSSSGGNVNIETAVFNNGTDADLVAGKLTAALAARSF